MENPFTQILTMMGQTITIHNRTRVISANGELSSIAEVDVDTDALVQEVGEKEKLYIQAGIMAIGDILFLVAPTTTINVYDTVTYSGDIYSIRKIFMPPQVYGELLFKRCLGVKDVHI